MTNATQVPEDAGPEWWAAYLDECDTLALGDDVELWMAGLQTHAPGKAYVALLGEVVEATRGT